ncbi:MAG: TatD family hydrolase [Solobacterium sp.]|nr:TatD family hydrolase [Solobacterium sp.]
MVYADAHCHLGSRQYDGDREDVIKRMLEKGVEDVIIICCSRHDLEEGARLRQAHPSFKLAVSIHPQDLEEDFSENRLDELRKAVRYYHPDMIGETGLDYYSHPHTKMQQKHFFRSQLEMASQFHLPVNIHSRKAAADTLEILREYPCRGIIHSYSGSIETARLCIKEGYMISFGASILFPGARRPKEVIAQIPADRLLLETDSPYQSPVIGHRHEPADVIRIYEETARIRGIPAEQLADEIRNNFRRVFA